MSNKLFLNRITSRNNFDMSHYHLTTMDIGFPQVQMCQPVIPTDSVNFNCQAFLRLSPLVFPTYARMRHKVINAYVANYMVDEYFEYAYTGQEYVGSIYTSPLTLKAYDLMHALSQNTFTDAGTAQNYDFLIITGGSPAYRKFNARGRRAYKIIKDLGYEIFSYETTSHLNENFNHLNAYPFLCYAQFVNDVILPQQLRSTSRLNEVLEDVKHRRVDTYYSQSAAQARVKRCYITEAAIRCILEDLTMAFAMYREDYFTTAWLYPNSPTKMGSTQIAQRLSFTDVDENADVSKLSVSQQSYDTYIDQDDQNYSSHINARSLQALQMFDKWVRRNNYVGSSTLNKVYSAFGIKTEQARSHFTDVINENSVNISISDVTSFSDTKSGSTGSDLGAYVGKGYSSGNIKCHFKAPDFGYVFCVSYIECDPLYARGFNRDVLVNNYQDFYQPEFDGLQASPISVEECISKHRQIVTGDGVFGFQPHYEWMRSKRDSVSGDLLTLESMESWYTAKPRGTTLEAQDPSVLQYALGTFNSIFQDQGDDVDHFICSFDFDMKMTRPIKTSSQATGLEQGSLVVDKFGNK